jgi:hypothetical protein
MMRFICGLSGKSALETQPLDLPGHRRPQNVFPAISKDSVTLAPQTGCRIIYDAVQTLRRFPESGKAGLEEGSRELVVPALPSQIVPYRV